MQGNGWYVGEPLETHIGRERGTLSDARSDVKSVRAEQSAGNDPSEPSRDSYAARIERDSTQAVYVRATHLRTAFFGLKVPIDTDQRVARWLETYAVPEPTVEGAGEILSVTFGETQGQIVFVKDIDFTALCEHHLLPFTGKAVVGYLSQHGENGAVVGLSKLARLVEYWTRVPTLQEHITAGIIQSLEHHLEPKGSVVVLYNVMHSCMSMRGIKDKHAVTTTSIVKGYFRDDVNARAEFMSLLALK